MNTIHGGNLDAIEREFGIPKEEILDFSGNVNPLGPPAPVLRALAENTMAITRYPDVEYRALRHGIAKYAGVDAECVIPGNGSTELIAAFMRMLEPKTAVVVSPAYSEYEREIELAGGKSRLFELKPENDFELDADGLIRFTSDADLLVICNPNNPTGTAVTTAQLDNILTSCPDTMVMVDETYAEFTDEPILSAGLLASHPNLFTVRGTSKFFAVPGLRLGYALCGDPSTRERLLNRKDPWSVNILSVLAGEAMFSGIDEMSEYIKRTTKLTTDWRALFTKTHFTDLRLYRSRANFMLARILTPGLTAGYIADELLRKAHILIRNATSFPYLDDSYFRFCMRLPDENTQLITELKEIINTYK